MKKYLVSGALIVSFAPRFCGGDLCCFRSRELQMLDDAQPASRSDQGMGSFKSEAEVKAAMAKMKECEG